jgi:hypothetical protein
LRRYTLGYNEDDEEEVAVNFKDGKVRRRRKTRREWGKIPDAMVRDPSETGPKHYAKVTKRPAHLRNRHVTPQ